MTYEIDERIQIEIDFSLNEKQATWDSDFEQDFHYTILSVNRSDRNKWHKPSSIVNTLICDYLNRREIDKLINECRDFQNMMRGMCLDAYR